MGFFNRKSPLIAVVAVGIYCLKQYMNGTVCTSPARIDGKVIIVTGANTGIGKETVLDLVKRGGKVYVACRSIERARQAVDEIKSATGVDDSRIPIMHLDLSSLASVRKFAKEFKQKEKKLDVLINNAGVMWVPQGRTEDGFETTIGVNHLGHFLLTNLLMDSLVSAAPSRIINVSSRAHLRCDGIRFDDIMYDKEFSRTATYSHSKLANVLFTRELAHRLHGKGVTAYALHPGVVRTELPREVSFIFDYAIGRAIFYVLTWPFMKEPFNGAQTQICCAVDEKLATQTGKYYADCEEAESSSAAQDDEAAKKLWNQSVDLVKLDQSDIHPLLR